MSASGDTKVATVPSATSDVSLPTWLVKPESEAALSAQNAKWLTSCPDPRGFLDMIKDHHWAETKVKCYNCKSVHARKDLREDDFTGYTDGGLMCQECWDFYTDPEQWILDPFAGNSEQPTVSTFDEAIPPHRRAAMVESKLKDGVLVHKATKMRVGTVKRYNPLSRSGFVTLDNMKDCAEHGPIGNDLEVVDTVVSKQARDDNDMHAGSDDDQDN
jgi:hypothetical protein